MSALLIKSFTLALTLAGVSLHSPVQQTAAESNGQNKIPVLETVDHFVPHISTVPASEGEEVELFVRERFLSEEGNSERCSNNKNRPVVLVVTGATLYAVPAFDVGFENYSWMSYLAENCFDVFAIEFTGYGLSPRPKMDDPCNASLDDQRNFLIPNPLEAPCAPSYSLPLESFQTASDEMDTVVDYIRALRGNDQLKINMIGWSRGGSRVIKYAAQRADRVDKVVLLAPGRLPPPPPAMASLRVFDRAAEFASWDSQLDPTNCPDQFDANIRDDIWTTILNFDELGNSWGLSGISRTPGLSPDGWDSNFPGMVNAPALVIGGLLDNVVPPPQLETTYNQLGSTQKVLVKVTCGSHFVPWERQHNVVLDASVQWLLSGTYHGCSSGCTFVE